jgi:hypothetical protein
MNRPRLVRIIACFVLTFAFGGATGWLLKPGPLPSPESARSLPPAERVMENLDAQLHLTPAQKQALKPILDEWGAQAERARNRPRRRRDLFEEYAPRIRLVLVPEQTTAYDRLINEARDRFDRRLRETR